MPTAARPSSVGFRSRRVRKPTLAALVVALAAAAPADAAERWRWPVRGEVVREFRAGAHPYAPGQHRGLDVAARPGEPVRAACTGRVTFAGRVPDRGRAVSVRCGGLVATHLGLRSITARGGEGVASGETVGEARGGHIQLGARRAAERNGYVDPRRLLTSSPSVPIGPAPARPRRDPGRGRPRAEPPRVGAPDTARRGEAARVGAPDTARGGEAARVGAPDTARVGEAPRVPALAWAGLALVLAAVPLGGAGVARGRRRRAAGAVRPATSPGRG